MLNMEDHFEKNVTKFNIDTTNPIDTKMAKGGDFQVFDIRLSRSEINKKGISYSELCDLGNTKKVQLMIDGEPIKMPEKLLKQFAIFARRSHGKLPEDFDCRSLVMHLNSQSHNYMYFQDVFEVTPLKDESELHTGDVIVISERDNMTRIHHYALYLDKGIYLSTSGPGTGSLMAAKLDAMKNAFGAQYVYRCVPKDHYQ
jgi:hypothetical protein